MGSRELTQAVRARCANHRRCSMYGKVDDTPYYKELRLANPSLCGMAWLDRVLILDLTSVEARRHVNEFDLGGVYTTGRKLNDTSVSWNSEVSIGLCVCFDINKSSRRIVLWLSVPNRDMTSLCAINISCCWLLTSACGESKHSLIYLVQGVR